MPLMIKSEKSKPLDAGPQQAVCIGVIDLGTQEESFPGTPPEKVRKVLFMWELPDVRFKATVNGVKVDEPKFIVHEYRLSLGAKSTLYKHLTSWRGRPFTKEELSGFDVYTVIGANCILNIIHKTNETTGDVKAKVDGISPIMKSMTKKPPELPIIKYNMMEDKFEVPALPKMLDWVKAKIINSEEWKMVERNKSNPVFQQAESDAEPEEVEESGPLSGSEIPF